MNVLFVLYHDFTANSAAHVHSLANSLADLGVHSAVCVPDHIETANTVGGEARYGAYLYDEVLNGGLRFRDSLGPDIVHVWTPREIVRTFLDRADFGKARVVVHLEDNEEHITARSLGKSWSDLRKMGLAELDKHVPANLSHPLRYRDLMQRADAATVIVDRLRDLVPAGKPVEEVWCSADENLFRETPVDYEARRKHDIPDDRPVIVYPGNVHAANAAEVRSLYTAVAWLNREGHEITLVRAGRDFHHYLDGDGQWAKRHTVDLGLVEHKDMPGVLAMADLFVQPGRPGEFNDYRFPSKLPEFLATGRPVILPASNIGLQMRHLEDAYIVPDADAINIARAILDVVGNPELAAKLAKGGRRFFEERLSWKQGALKLYGLYSRLLGADQAFASAS